MNISSTDFSTTSDSDVVIYHTARSRTNMNELKSFYEKCNINVTTLYNVQFDGVHYVEGARSEITRLILSLPALLVNSEHGHHLPFERILRDARDEEPYIYGSKLSEVVLPALEPKISPLSETEYGIFPCRRGFGTNAIHITLTYDEYEKPTHLVYYTDRMGLIAFAKDYPHIRMEINGKRIYAIILSLKEAASLVGKSVEEVLNYLESESVRLEEIEYLRTKKSPD